ncbi:MAG TPA: invasin domain 3-containing protein, partial [Solirubrobacteraceae bacterium]|nr:invasin domain 3-containing protein [Solirubrobacteraceae bacterium]
MNDEGHEERIRLSIEAAADAMPDLPIRWERVVSLSRRKVLISFASALGLVALVAVLLAAAGNYGSYSIHGSAPLPLPVSGVSVPDVTGLSATRAVSRLTQAGLKATSENQCPPAGSCIVSHVHPEVGANVLKGASVELRLSPLTHGERSSRSGPGGKHVSGSKKHLKKTTPSEGRPKPARIDLSLSAKAIPADGKSFVTAEVTVLDARGRALSGQHVTFSQSAPQDVVEHAVTVGSTIYVATIKSSRTGGAVTVMARDGAIVESKVFEQNCPSSEGAGGATTTTSAA